MAVTKKVTHKKVQGQTGNPLRPSTAKNKTVATKGTTGKPSSGKGHKPATKE